MRYATGWVSWKRAVERCNAPLPPGVYALKAEGFARDGRRWAGHKRCGAPMDSRLRGNDPGGGGPQITDLRGARWVGAAIGLGFPKIASRLRRGPSGGAAFEFLEEVRCVGETF
jgi:hypothetical protein